MIRLRVFLGTACALAAIAGTMLRAQSNDDQKKKTPREEMRAVVSPTPSETPEPKAKPKPAKRKSKSKKKQNPTPNAKPTKSPRPKKGPAADDDDEESPTPKSKNKSPAKKNADDDEDATPKPKAKASETAGSTKSPGTKKSPKPELEKTASPKKKADSDDSTAKSKRIEKAESAKSPGPSPTASKTTIEPFNAPAEPSAVPRPAPRPTQRPIPPQTQLPSDITIEKSGLEQEQGFEPPPPPPPKKGWWPFSRQPANYRYLTAANIEAIRRAPVQRARWKFIIVHNSGTRQGSAKVFDYYHRRVRRMKNGLAYHFVIGNGTSTRNGQIEIGERWTRQIRGGHVHSDYMNNMGLGICLVGDFNRDQPTRAQLDACEELIKYLQERCGKMQVRPHREVNPPRWATDCPGDVFPYGWFGRFR
ncbi:MAG: N-acetylmuramoyl-L-alanine amidase [Chthoniobacterales bacterium]